MRLTAGRFLNARNNSVLLRATAGRPCSTKRQRRGNLRDIEQKIFLSLRLLLRKIYLHHQREAVKHLAFNRDYAYLIMKKACTAVQAFCFYIFAGAVRCFLFLWWGLGSMLPALVSAHFVITGPKSS